MSSQELPVVITAIADAQVEGFIASTLFTQGWSVIYRAIDSQSLEEFITNNPERAQNSLLIFAPDLDGINVELIAKMTQHVKQIVGFSQNPEIEIEFPELHRVPITATDLVSIIRGLVRAPMMRQTGLTSRQKRKSCVIAVGSAGSGTGCTTIALNLAMELSVLGKSTLIIDANFRAPSIATLISIRNVQGEAGWRTIAPNLAIAEVAQSEALAITEFMENAVQNFEMIVIDLGSISGLSNRLTDRRWTSTMTTWSCDQADELMVIARPDLLGLHRLEQVTQLLEQTSIHAQISFLLNMRSPGRKGEDEEAKFLATTTKLRPLSVRVVSKDSRAASSSLEEKTTLIEVNQRSVLRKSIAKIAIELSR